MSILNILTVSLGAVLAENLVFVRFLGLSPMLSSTDSVKRSVKHGITIGIALTASSLLAWLLDTVLLAPLGIEYMRTLLFVLVLCGGVKICENVLGTRFREHYSQLGISFNTVTASSALLGVMLIASNGSYNLFEALFFGLFAGAGYIASSVIFAAIREHLEYSESPEFLEGTPMLLITLGLISLAFMGFSGMKFI